MKTCTKCNNAFLGKYCKPCRKVYNSSWYEKNASVVKARSIKYYQDHKEQCTMNNLLWTKANPTKVSLSKLKWRTNNPEVNRTLQEQYFSNHRSYYVSKGAEYRARKLHATPSWLTLDDLFVIEEMYDLARLRTATTAIKWEVDHIVPLRGELVCGLHIPSNLRVIPKRDNCQKGNRYVCHD